MMHICACGDGVGGHFQKALTKKGSGLVFGKGTSRRN